MPEKQLKIFVNYRRADEKTLVGLIRTHFMYRYGHENVIMDVDPSSLPDFVDFPDHLRTKVRESDVVAMMIGSRWDELLQEKAQDDVDYVLMELREAVDQGIMIAPIRLNNAPIPKLLPDWLKFLRQINAPSISDDHHLDSVVLRFMDSFEARLKERESSQQVTPPKIMTPHKAVPAQPTLGSRMTDGKGVIMVYVPPGEFMMGSEDYGSEKPVHKQIIKAGFWLDLTPVTNASYAQFVAAGGYKNRDFWTEAGWQWLQQDKRTGPADNDPAKFGDPQKPRVGITWFEANAYAKWRGGRLPTEAEWEWAARGPENRVYPWGDTFDGTRIIYGENSGDMTAVVGDGIRADGASWVGALDMSGNVWEWTNSIYMPYPFDSDDGRESNSSTNSRVLRGGSWRNNNGDNLRADFRSRYASFDWNYFWGFRLARSLEF